jgi:hypothetical protein
MHKHVVEGACHVFLYRMYSVLLSMIELHMQVCICSFNDCYVVN